MPSRGVLFVNPPFNPGNFTGPPRIVRHKDTERVSRVVKSETLPLLMVATNGTRAVPSVVPKETQKKQPPKPN